MGINSSGVRQIAEANGTGDHERISRTAIVLRRVAVALGLVGALALLLLREPIAVLTFGNADHATSVGLLCLALFLRVVADGQGALLQGVRRIGDMARFGFYSALMGTVISIPLVYWLREEGVAWSLVSMALASALVGWWYARKVPVQALTIDRGQWQVELSGLLRLGLAFMFSGLMTMGAMYVVRIILIRQTGLEAAGLYQAAWTLGGMYVGFVLQAMGADFYPRLVGVSKDNAQTNRLVNEQVHVGLLLSGAGVIGTLTLAPLVINLFYSSQFVNATESLRWVCLGIALRVVTWPMGYIIVARGATTTFALADAAWAIVNVLLTWWFVKWFGLDGAGIAFFLSYVFHGLMIYPIVRHMSGFRWTSQNLRTAGLVMSLTAAAFCALRLLPAPWGTACGLAIALIALWHSLHSLLSLVSHEQLPRRLQKLLKLIRLRGPLTSPSA